MSAMPAFLHETDVQIRPEVVRFAEAMERKLQEVEARGTREIGEWKTTAMEGMWDHLQEERDEVDAALMDIEDGAPLTVLQKELSDEANLCMFLWNRLQMEMQQAIPDKGVR